MAWYTVNIETPQRDGSRQAGAFRISGKEKAGRGEPVRPLFLLFLLTVLLCSGCATVRLRGIVHLDQYGLASWYGPGFHGKPTASGERYNMYKLTAAHRSLEFNTLVRVTNLLNGRRVVVRINDRGPFVRGRVIDLSYQAARRLGMVNKGVVPVAIEILRRP